MGEIKNEYISAVLNNKGTLREQIKPLSENFKREALIYGKDEVKFLNVPYIIDKKMYEDFRYIADTTYGILSKVTAHFIKDRSYRRLFGFGGTLTKLICAPSNYDCPIPIMRMDIFYDEETGKAKFCEINTDGASAMKEAMDIQACFEKSLPFEEVTKKHALSYQNLYENLTDAVLECYKGYKYKCDTPVIAIADYTESATMPEFEVIKRIFEEKGYECIIANVREFTFKHKYLYYGEKKIDLVYRRAVTGEVMAKIADSKAFIKNALEGRTALIGHFKTQVAHNKILFTLLTKPATQKILTEEEIAFINEYIPFTTQLKSGNYDYNEVKYSKDKWVVKPKDMYGASNVFVGVDQTQEQWEEKLDFGVKNDYLLQQYCKPYQSDNSYFDEDGKLVSTKVGSMCGIYMFGGKMAGFFCRASEKGIITGHDGGFSMATFTEE